MKILKDGLQYLLWLLITKRKARFLIVVLHFVIGSRKLMKRARVFMRAEASHQIHIHPRFQCQYKCEAFTRVKTSARFIRLRLSITKCKTPIKKRALRFVISSHNTFCKPSFTIFTGKCCKIKVTIANIKNLCHSIAGDVDT